MSNSQSREFNLQNLQHIFENTCDIYFEKTSEFEAIYSPLERENFDFSLLVVLFVLVQGRCADLSGG